MEDKGKIMSQLGTFHKGMSDRLNNLLGDPEAFGRCRERREIESRTGDLQDILGKQVPSPFQSSFTPGKFKIPISKEMSTTRSTIGRVKAVKRAVMGMHDWYKDTGGRHTVDTKKKGQNISAFRAAVNRYKDKAGVLRPPHFTHRKFTLQDEEVMLWMADAEAARRKLWVTYRLQEAEYRLEGKRVFTERYRREAAKYSHQLRVMCYPKDRTEAVMAIMTEEGEIVMDKHGILEAFRSSWAKLGRKPTRDTSDQTASLDEFVSGVPVYDAIRERVQARTGEVLQEVEVSELTEVIDSTPNKACNPLDLVEINTLKVIFNLCKPSDTAGGDLDVEVRNICEENCTNLRTLVLGLINSIMLTRIFPKQLLQGVIVPLFKKGDSRDLNNYRGITLLPIIYKLVTKIINNRMTRIITESDGITHAQAAGKANFSCLTQVNVFQNVVKHAQRNNKALYILSTDVRKAFDTVDFGAFVNSLKFMGFDDGVMQFIHNLQSGFQCTVRSPVGNTDFFPIEQGCKQGCALSPLRFNIVYDIFLKFIEHAGMGYKWKMKYMRLPKEAELEGKDGCLNIPGCAFADDNLLVSDDPDEFVEMVRLFSTFLRADEEVANEHHIFCKCPAMAGVYEEGANRLADKIDGLLPLNRPASTTRTMIKGMLLPSQRKDFLYGKVPEELRRWLVSNIGQASSDKLKGRIRPLVRDFFFDIWCSYTAKIVEGGHDFASRLRKRYEIKEECGERRVTVMECAEATC
ncbi:hypothetical protein CYMTET_50988 [Cymbomonas tetramitiformis]|uniref:Reverse transcriptase domain-containing protein n=1 Tax=Cymbomonas tetramitiformis TaxID=36881 RepID=A0AAE0BNP9_9CHLO|nr:hypothetical protein CYMTET_50988 [Cymbomonas tetramitiformis]